MNKHISLLHKAIKMDMVTMKTKSARWQEIKTRTKKKTELFTKLRILKNLIFIGS